MTEDIKKSMDNFLKNVKNMFNNMSKNQKIFIYFILLLLILLMLMRSFKKREVLDGADVIFFYSKRCGFCVRMTGEWEKFKKLNDKNKGKTSFLIIKEVDVNTTSLDTSMYKLTGVPHIVKIENGKKKVYKGDRKGADIYNFCKKN